MLNFAIIAGRLVRDPELRYTANNTAVATYTVAVDRDRKNSDGSKETDFINCVSWRQAGEFVSKYFFKGSFIIVSGRLQMREYTDRNGNKRTAAEIVSRDIYFGDSKKQDAKPDFTELDDLEEFPE